MVEGGRLLWFSPDPRGLLPVDEGFHVSRRLAWTVRRGRFTCTVNRCFSTVMRLCARGEDAGGTWISPEMLIAYGRLHELGLAHSVEAWPAETGPDERAVGGMKPVGGVYGVAIGGAFFAESMFHTTTDAGTVALVHLIRQLRANGFVLCDVQWTTDHLRRFGAFDMSRQQYLRVLDRAVRLQCRFDSPK